MIWEESEKKNVWTQITKQVNEPGKEGREQGGTASNKFVSW